MKLKTLLILFAITFLLSTFNYCKAQDTSHLRISLLTCTPSDELYATFGHSALRVVDSNSVTDYVYNYGTFNFDDENFYLKFIRGKLPYYVIAEDFLDFKTAYQYENRGITEQQLNLSAAEKINIQQFLNNNIKDENKYYQYDFFFDNCTTRLRDILKKQHDSTFTKKPVMPVGTTFRQAIHHYLNKSNNHWSKLGIDILLGKPCDAVMTAPQMQFLPDNLMLSLDSSNHNDVISTKNLYQLAPQKITPSFFTPTICFTALLIFIVLLSFLKNKYSKLFLSFFDFLLFFSLGILGCVLIFMWFGTDHSITKNNFNLLWALPTHFIAAFFVTSNKNWVKKYFKFTTIAMVVLLAVWYFLPQQLNGSLLPIAMLVGFRSFKISSKNS
jgi:hypothetical protein